jgi:hypothetical protein
MRHLALSRPRKMPKTGRLYIDMVQRGKINQLGGRVFYSLSWRSKMPPSFIHESKTRVLSRKLSGTMGVTLIIATCLFSASALAHVISEEDHHAFEHKYADMCVKKEKANPNRVITSDDSPIINLCECIAQEESKRLTIDEVKKFLRENKYPVSLLIKAGQAENICSQKLRQTKQ